MPMRIRVRGPQGQSTASFEDSATINDLRIQITKLAGLDKYDVKFGYPPKPLDLDQFEQTQLLSGLSIKLNGEQLLVSRKESAASGQPAIPTPAHSKTPVDTNATTKIATGSTSKELQEPKAPLSLARKKKKEMDDPPEIFMPELGGTLVLRIMPDDNSCLFRAISSAVMSDLDAVTELRSIVAETIQAQPEQFNKAVLDNKDPSVYCRWIKSQDSWGGQVELMILAQHFAVEICSIDVQTLRVDRYNEGAGKRCFVVYSGIHYDTIALSMFGEPPENDVKQFEPPFNDEVLPKAVELCKELQRKHYFTDTSGFKIVCNDCGVQLRGEKGATEHAASTGHYNFGEAD